MDATTLRIVLLVLGVVFLGAIYLYETRRRKREIAQAQRRVAPEFNEPQISESMLADEPDSDPVMHDDQDKLSTDEEDTWAEWDDEDTEQLYPGVDGIEGMHAEDDPESDLELSAGEAAATPEQQELFGFSAQEESPVDVPKLILQINLKAKSAPFNGVNIQKAMNDVGLVLGKLPIYQRLSSDSRQNPQFNIASMVEPGTFPDKDLEQFETPGLTLFTQLPVPGGDGMAVFSDMLFTAERLAATLNGELQDETHSALTKQTIEHLRGQITEHRRQVQLARSKG
ncbi:MAG: cell division protein ZipA C-terminal FtsZ-binding domain-containing protein [Candidatus Thiodiazotropha sp. 6PLUC1]